MNNLIRDRNKQIVSILDIAGKDENALTKAFAVIVRKDKTLLNYLINKACILANKKPVKVSQNMFNATTFELEHHIFHGRSRGRTDIKIHNDLVTIYVESKIKTNEVTYKQANKYSQDLNRSRSKLKLFVFICEIGNVTIDKRLIHKYPNIGYTILNWADTLEMVAKRGEIKADLVEEYKQYIKEKRNMKIHDIDIWAVSISKASQEKNYKKGYYVNSNKHLPIMIGRREWDPKLHKVVIRELAPVIAVFDKNYPVKGVLKAKNDYVYKLSGNRIVLKEPIIRKFGQNSAIALDFKDI